MSAGVVAALVGGAFAPVGATSSPAYVVVHNCQEEQAFVDGDPAAVAARLPQRYTAVRDPVSHAPVLFMRAERCSVQINGDASPATMASFGVVVQSPDGRGCASGVPVVGGGQGAMPPVCNWYTLRWFATSQPVVDWLQAGTPDFPAAYAPGLVFTLGGNDPTRGGAPFEFRAPAATQAPFAMHAITQQRPGTLIVRGGYWADTAAGTVKLAFSTDTLTSGSARGFVTAPPGTEVAALLGAPQRAYLPGYSALAAEQFSRGIYRKQVDAPAQDAHAFAGSCVVKGTVTFTPPATNVPQPLHYDYPAIGTCSGALDGRHIEKAGVRLHQAGSSYGGCSNAHTTTPGLGTLRFVGGAETLDYTVDFQSIATSVNMTFYGDRSGTARAHGTFLTTRTSPDVVLACGGSGARHVPMNTKLVTQTPLRG